jgi:hypothetical protein
MQCSYKKYKMSKTGIAVLTKGLGIQQQYHGICNTVNGSLKKTGNTYSTNTKFNMFLNIFSTTYDARFPVNQNRRRKKLENT